jgi:hypothetical protein
LDDVRVILGAPTAPKGEADRGGSAGTSFHGSLGEKEGGTADNGADTARGDGLNATALALSIRGEDTGDPDDDGPDAEGSACVDEDGERVASLRARPDVGYIEVGVSVPDAGNEGDCGLPRGVRARKDGRRVGVNGLCGAAVMDAADRVLVGVR